MGTFNLDKIFKPRNVALLGASDTVGSVGHAVATNFVNGAFAGKTYFVNNHRSEILGQKAYPTVEAIPEVVDLAIIATPAKTVSELVDQCGRAA